MRAGNANYKDAKSLPTLLRVFPLSGALLLPGGQLPLNLFEPRYLEMFNDALKDDRLIGMVQPLGEPTIAQEVSTDNLDLYEMGCVGRITAFQETGDGRILVNLSGICRYRLHGEADNNHQYRQFRPEYLLEDLIEPQEPFNVDRERLLETFKRYLDHNSLEADWESVEDTKTDQLVNSLCMMSPYGPAEKQALLEAETLEKRAEALIAMTDMELSKTQTIDKPVLQ